MVKCVTLAPKSWVQPFKDEQTRKSDFRPRKLFH